MTSSYLFIVVECQQKGMMATKSASCPLPKLGARRNIGHRILSPDNAPQFGFRCGSSTAFWPTVTWVIAPKLLQGVFGEKCEHTPANSAPCACAKMEVPNKAARKFAIDHGKPASVAAFLRSGAIMTFHMVSGTHRAHESTTPPKLMLAALAVGQIGCHVPQGFLEF